MVTHYVIQNRWALGDTVILSAFVRDLNLTYPGQYQLAMSGHYCNVFWKNNPHVYPLEPVRNARVLKFDYRPGIAESGRGIKKHFLSWFYRDFEQLTGVHVPVRYPKGDIHLSAKEKAASVPGRYWVVVAGGKLDMTAKIWYADRFQEVVDRLAHYGISCVQSGATFHRNVHPVLRNVQQCVGKTNSERDFFSLIYNAEGVICGVTAAMHIAACFDKPCVVLAGGREEPWWEAYVNDYFPEAFGPDCAPVKTPHKFLHTVGLLDCCKARGCWKARTVPIEPADLTNAENRSKLCLQPVRRTQAVPKCLDMLTVDHVVEAVMQYYEEGKLPPIGQPKGTYRPGTEEKPVSVEPDTTTSEVKAEAATNVQVSSGLSLPLPQDVPRLLTNPMPPELKKLPGESRHFQLLDHPILDGKVTICVLTWGDNRPLIERCLGKIMETVPANRRDIRVALNQPSKASLDFVQGFDRDEITKIYLDQGTRRKYPAMREMFYDSTCPITTKYVVWFDDDSFPVDKLWLPKLAEVIIPNHKAGARLFGIKMYHDLTVYAKNGHRPEQWFKQAPWWRGVDLRLRGREQLGTNGSCIDFAVGWFWACEYNAIVQCHIPDVRLGHNGGDAAIGAQIHQGGYRIKMFNEGKKYVFTPPKDKGGRRGYSEPFPWADPESKQRHRTGE